MYPQAATAILPESRDYREGLDELRVSGQINDSAINGMLEKFDGKRVTCLANKISDTGAILESKSRKLPKYFVLDVKEERLQALCNRVWAQGRTCGVQFLASRRASEWRF